MRYLIVIVVLLVAVNVAAEDVYVDVGGCPGEGCHYDALAVAKRPVAMHQSADADAEVLYTIREGESMRALTGEVHTVPGRLIIRRTEGEFSIGDAVLVYTYLGEGWFRVLHNGQLKDADLGFSPWGGSAGSRCELDAACFGTLQEELRSQWWIYVRAENNMEGWVLHSIDNLEWPQVN